MPIIKVNTKRENPSKLLKSHVKRYHHGTIEKKSYMNKKKSEINLHETNT